jgi:hypothetical protein
MARRLDPWLTETIEIFASPQYVPPWASASDAPAQGDIFTSNVEVAEYFRLVYGFTRSRWLEEVAQREQTGTNASFSRIYAVWPGGTLIPQEDIESDAKRAFDTFCRITSDVSKDAEPGAPPNVSPATPVGSSKGLREGRHL